MEKGHIKLTERGQDMDHSNRSSPKSARRPCHRYRQDFFMTGIWKYQEMLLVDAGNTFIKWALTHAERPFAPGSVVWKEFGAVRHHDLSSLKNTWQDLHRKSPFERVIISNVAGQNLGNTLFEFLTSLEPRPQKIDWFYSAPSLAGVQNTYLDYRKLGSDRFASMVGARGLFPEQALIVVTAGTATTIDALTPDGTFMGGMILPGLKLMAESLAQNTAQLPEVSQNNAGISCFANETGNAIISGCINAQAGAIERAVTDHGKHFDNIQCLLSGGAARYIAPNLSIPYRIVDNLVLIGLHRSSI